MGRAIASFASKRNNVGAAVASSEGGPGGAARRLRIWAALAVALAAVLLSPHGAQAWTYTDLHKFCTQTGCTDGLAPEAGLTLSSSGNLYGTTGYGGASIFNAGVVFALVHDGSRWIERVLYNFCPYQGCSDGSNPYAGVVADANDNLFGTTFYGGADGGYGGTVFELSPNRQKTKWTEKVLYGFCEQTNCVDGGEPMAGVILDGAGNLYGTTPDGGVNCQPNPGCGTVFKVSAEGGETVLYSFCAKDDCADGAFPYAGLTMDSSGNFYGTTESGGIAKCESNSVVGCGVVFKLDPSGVETVLYRFCSRAYCADGANPTASLIRGRGGYMYGTTEAGGANGGGTVFKVGPRGAETVLYSFCAKSRCADGAAPEANLAMDAQGDLFGTTSIGGAYGYGAIFEVAAGGGESTLFSFCEKTNCPGGSNPATGLVLDSKGNLYGTTIGGGITGCAGEYVGCGTVFELAK